ncbi:MAG: DNA adenine methylase [Treponema sp.]|nr:DNA adenine methylase [Treponema sp.]
MRTPITYYGGKQQLASSIVKLIPPHRIYAEPFIGGAAVFFAKPPSECEIINDINSEVVNFYEVVQRDFTALQSEINISLHSRKMHKHARVIYENPDMFCRIKRAWAFWMLANMSFGSMLDGGWGYDLTGQTTLKVNNKKGVFEENLAIRLQNIQIEYCDALKIIRSRDVPDAFFYLDSPYPDTDQGHYDGYSAEDFRSLLETCANIEGKFLLSSFRHSILDEYTKKYKWSQFELKMKKSITAWVGEGKSSHKIEVLTANYQMGKGGYGIQDLFIDCA